MTRGTNDTRDTHLFEPNPTLPRPMVSNRGEAMNRHFCTAFAAAAFSGALFATTATAAPLSLVPFGQPYGQAYQAPQAMAYAPVETEDAATAPSKFKRQVVSYPTHEAPGTIVIDTPNTFLYLV